MSARCAAQSNQASDSATGESPPVSSARHARSVRSRLATSGQPLPGPVRSERDAFAASLPAARDGPFLVSADRPAAATGLLARADVPPTAAVGFLARSSTMTSVCPPGLAPTTALLPHRSAADHRQPHRTSPQCRRTRLRAYGLSSQPRCVQSTPRLQRRSGTSTPLHDGFGGRRLPLVTRFLPVPPHPNATIAPHAPTPCPASDAPTHAPSHPHQRSTTYIM
jgi:hypothetical protein